MHELRDPERDHGPDHAGDPRSRPACRLLAHVCSPIPLAPRCYSLEVYTWDGRPGPVKSLQVHYESSPDPDQPDLTRACSWRYKALYRRRRERVGSQQPRQSEPGTVEARRGTKARTSSPSRRPKAEGRRLPRRLVGPAGRARYSAVRSGRPRRHERTGPRGSGQVGWYREGLSRGSRPYGVERRSALGAGAFV